ncbi:MAG: Flp pilus assembly protein CpaB [Alphaproteobacteria bacterium]|nr:Flp pilus assembly protein CpaB [Alphaproteobacteria bacterium]
MNKNVLIVLGGAVLVAILVAVLVQVTLGGKQKKQVAQEARVEILVAAQDLGIGRELQPGDLRWQEWPKSSVFPGALTRKDKTELAEKALEGRLSRNIAQGEPVMKNALLGQSKGNFVAASLEPGMRAMAIEVSASSMVAGFLGPGDHVDIILTYKETINTEDSDPRVHAMIEKNLDKLATETILQNVKVLAVDQIAERKDDDKIKVGKTVTVSVSAEDAEKLSLAAEIGELMLSLRGVGDDKIITRTWPTISDARLTTMDDEIFTEYDKIKKDAGIHSNSVRIYNGAAVAAQSSP